MPFSAVSTADRFLPRTIAGRVRPLLERVDSQIFAAEDKTNAGRTSLTAFAIRIASALIALLSQVLMARWMGSFEYGIFVLVWTTMLILGNLSCLGFHTSLVRYIPEYRVRGRIGELRAVMQAARRIVTVLSLLIAAIGLFGIWFFAESFESYYIIPFYLGFVCMPIIAISDVLEGTARANSWAMLALAPIYILRPVLILFLMAAAMYLDYPHTGETAMICAILATLMTTLWQAFSILPRTSDEIRNVRPVFRTREWVLVSLPIFLVEGFVFMMTNADVLMVGWFMDPHDVAIYFATVKILALVHFVYFAVKAGVAQRYAEYATGNQHDRLKSFARATVAWTFWPSLLMAIGVLIIGKPMLMLFGPGFEAGYPLLFVLVLGVLARASVGPAESLLTMTGNQNVCAAIYAITLAINVTLAVLLIPAWGLWGAAAAMVGAMTSEAALLAFFVWRKLGIAMVVPLRQAA